ncbi:MAG: peptide chain release factor 1 [Butyrivibrio sp.]|nr:peptide chain release factor 1 [Butyrivibrio sp.]
MFDRLEDIIRRYEDITMMLGDPSVVSDQAKFRSLMKEQKSLEALVECYKQYKETKQTIEDSLMLLDEESDPEMKEMLRQELSDAKDRIPELEEKLRILLLPKDPNDEKNVIVEIRAGVGGDEAALFAADMFRLYTRYAERRAWKIETLSVEDIGIGGIKTVSFMIKGDGAYSRLKFESGVHRVQRIPSTESGGRIHTSAITVAIMPEVEDVEVEIDMNDCKFDVFRASGNGGQCVNTTDSAVRLTHLPTGIVISCQDEKSQQQNKAKALKVLRAKLYEMEQERKHNDEAQLRKSQVGSGDRSEKIRTYNFHQGRVTDHRIGLTLYKIDQIMDGDLDEIIDSLIAADQAEKLASSQE